MVPTDRPAEVTTTAAPPGAAARRPWWARVSRLEVVLGTLVGVVMIGLVVAEPDILRAPFQNWRTLLFTFGGTALAAGALSAMLAGHVPPVVRVVVLGVPLVVVSWWLISPFFLDEEVQEGFDTSIAAARTVPTGAPSTSTPATSAAPAVDPSSTSPATTAVATSPATTPTTPTTPTTAATGPMLRGAGRFEGLAGHDGSGDAGIFRTDDGAHVLRLENLDIDNGPDLRLYVLPGADQITPGDGAVYLGPLRGNVGNLTYDLPTDFRPGAGPWTVLVWCEAFDVEFVGATLAIA